MRRLPAAVSERFASERYPLCKGMGQTQQKIMAVIGQQLRHALFRQWQGLCFQHCSQLFRVQRSGSRQPTLCRGRPV